jgi:hypothetical protein
MTEMHASPGGHHAPDSGGAILQTVSVADLLDRRVALEWFESVAVVAGLCSSLVERQATGVPALSNIVLMPAGSIALAGRIEDMDPAALPRVLHQLLAVVPPPTALRLFVLHAISTEGDKSPAAFEKALAYYERPGRDELIRAVRQKYFDTPLPLPGSAPPKPFELPVIEPTPEPTPVATRRPRRVLAIGLALSASAVVAVVAAGRSGHAPSANVLNTVDVLMAKTGEVGRSVAAAVAGSLTSPGAEQREMDVASEVTPAPAPPARRRSTRRSTASTQQSATAAVDEVITTGATEPSTTPESSVVAEPSPTAAALPEASGEPAPVPVGEGFDAVIVEPTSSAATTDDNGIVPPRLIEPIRLPAWVDPMSHTPVSSIELEIGIDGTVSRVRMVSPAMRLTDMMILSAAKTWVFAPASLEGRPVPYRLTLGLAENR